MLENQQNKMQKKDTIKTEEVFEQDYTFPEYGIVIKATSLEQAIKKLEDQITPKKQ